MIEPYYQDGWAQIYYGDNAAILPSLPDESVDLTVTSPPYDNLRNYNGYSFDFETVAKELYRITKQGGVVVWVVGDATIDGSETGTSFRQALYFKDVCGFNLHDTMIYEATGTGAKGSNDAYWQAFEYMFVLTKGKPKTINRIADMLNSNFGKLQKGSNGGRDWKNGKSTTRIRTNPEFSVRPNIWRIPSTSSDTTSHPAPFPETLANDHIRSWSNPGDTILDCFCGSGTTAKMARLNGCKFIGIEISKEYCKLSVSRLRQEVFTFAVAD